MIAWPDLTMKEKIWVNSSRRLPVEGINTQPLECGAESETLKFLSARPVHTVVMSSFIMDNGMVSPLNRGTFYGCRNEQGELQGIALIGHVTMVEVRTEAALQSFANLAREYPLSHVIIGEHEKVERFWAYFTRLEEVPHLVSRELLLERRWPVEVGESACGLRPATLEDLDRVAEAHAGLALEEHGENPAAHDRQGFYSRCARRIDRGRVWVWIEAGRLIFKADVVSDTPDVVYLEGIYVNPGERGKGYGLKCLLTLSNSLLERTRSICLLVKERNQRAQAFYRKAGYRLHSYYDTILLKRR